MRIADDGIEAAVQLGALPLAPDARERDLPALEPLLFDQIAGTGEDSRKRSDKVGWRLPLRQHALLRWPRIRHARDLRSRHRELEPPSRDVDRIAELLIEPGADRRPVSCILEIQPIDRVEHSDEGIERRGHGLDTVE